MSVISFAAFRSIRELKTHRQDLCAVLDNVRQSLGRLFETGLCFHLEGSRAARDLLDAQEHLTLALDALDGLPDDTDERNDEARRIHGMLASAADSATRAMDRLQALSPKS